MAPTFRYVVSICFANYRDPNKALVLPELGAPLGSMPISVEQPFSSKIDAEIFARAVSRLLPRRDEAIEEGVPLAWVLVSALATSHAVRVSTGAEHCYLAFDGGGVLVKRHPIGAGYYGARCTTCNQSREAA